MDVTLTKRQILSFSVSFNCRNATFYHLLLKCLKVLEREITTGGGGGGGGGGGERERKRERERRKSNT